jgi:putative addiction module component (TIGR02574 family)
MNKITVSDLLELSVSERIQLVEYIWDSIVAVPDAIQLTDTQKEELDRRLSSYYKNREEGSPWELVRERIRNEG